MLRTAAERKCQREKGREEEKGKEGEGGLEEGNECKTKYILQKVQEVMEKVDICMYPYRTKVYCNILDFILQ